MKLANEHIAEARRLSYGSQSFTNFAGTVDIPGKPYIHDDDQLNFGNDSSDDFEKITTGLAAHHIIITETVDRLIDFVAWKHFHDNEAGKRINYERHDAAMLLLPPGSAKSTYGNVAASAYIMGKLPGVKVLNTSHSSPIAKKQGRRTRMLCKNDDFMRMFDTTISHDTSAADDFMLTNNSEFMSGGIQSGITGNRCHFNVNDDPVRGQKDADSEAVTNTIFEEYESSITTRGLPDYAELLILTHWSELDLAGRILPDDWDGESGRILCKDDRYWDIVCIQAECQRPDTDPLSRKKGEMLWPEWFNDEHWARHRKNKRKWGALFQQTPAPDDGTFYTRDMFSKRWTTLPANLEYYIGADYATTEDGGDYTEQGLFGVDENRYIYVTDWFTGQVTAKTWLRTLFEFIKKYKVHWHVAEPGIIRRMSEETIKDKMVAESIYFSLKWIGGGSSKLANAYSFKNLCEQGRVIWPKDNEVTERVIEQLIKGLGSRNDDAFDACSCFGLEITKAWAAKPPKPKKKPKQSEHQFIKGLELAKATKEKTKW